MASRAVEVELLFGKIPNIACFSCGTPFTRHAARHMGQDGTSHHFVLVTCEACGNRSVLAFFVERPEITLGELSAEAQAALARERALRELVGSAESVVEPGPEPK